MCPVSAVPIVGHIDPAQYLVLIKAAPKVHRIQVLQINLAALHRAVRCPAGQPDVHETRTDEETEPDILLTHRVNP